jgi:hypothetical protein
MENMDFGSGGSQILQYIPTIEEQPSEPPVDRMEPVGTRRGTDDLRVPHPEKNSAQIEMDFSTPISEVMPSAAFDSGVDSATYNSPTTQRVTGVSPGMIGGPPTKSDSKNPLGLTDEQFQAAIAGLSAVVAFSKPVQDKLADMIPKFFNEAGNMSSTGMAVSALLAAIVFFFALKLLKNQK